MGGFRWNQVVLPQKQTSMKTPSSVSLRRYDLLCLSYAFAGRIYAWARKATICATRFWAVHHCSSSNLLRTDLCRIPKEVLDGITYGLWLICFCILLVATFHDYFIYFVQLTTVCVSSGNVNSFRRKPFERCRDRKGKIAAFCVSVL